MKRYLYAGLMTKRGDIVSPTGIHVFEMDPQSGVLNAIQAVESGPNPSFLAIHPSLKCLFCVNETIDGTVSSFRIDPENGKLTFINQVKSGGDEPCYITVDPSGRYLLAANYYSGTLGVIPIGPDGRLEECSQVVRHIGCASLPAGGLKSMDNQGLVDALGRSVSPGKVDVPKEVWLDRQESAHAHCILFDPGEKYALSADLGMDRVWVYPFQNGRLLSKKQPVSGINFRPGAGPRHIAFHPNGRFAYVSNELNSSVSVLTWDRSSGELEDIQSIPTLPAGFQGINYPAHLTLTPDGRFLYVSNRGHNSLAVFGVNSETGLLSTAGNFATGGDWPRHFCIDPSGKLLVAANQKSDTVITYRICQTDGSLEQTGPTMELFFPMFLMIIDI